MTQSVKIYLILTLVWMVSNQDTSVSYSISLQYLTYGPPNNKAVMSNYGNRVVAKDYSDSLVGSIVIYEKDGQNLKILRKFTADPTVNYNKWFISQNGDKVVFDVITTPSRSILIYNKGTLGDFANSPNIIDNTQLSSLSLYSSTLIGISPDATIFCFGQNSQLKIATLKSSGAMDVQTISLGTNINFLNMQCKFSQDNLLLGVVHQGNVLLFNSDSSNQYVFNQKIQPYGYYYHQINSIDISADTLTLILSSVGLTQVHTRVNKNTYFTRMQILPKCSGLSQKSTISGDASQIFIACDRKSIIVYAKRKSDSMYEFKQEIIQRNDNFIYTNTDGSSLMIPDTNTHSLYLYAESSSLIPWYNTISTPSYFIIIIALAIALPVFTIALIILYMYLKRSYKVVNPTPVSSQGDKKTTNTTNTTINSDLEIGKNQSKIISKTDADIIFEDIEQNGL